MNSSSVPAVAIQPRSASRSSWRRRIWRGEATTSRPSSQPRSAISSAVAVVPRDRPQRVHVRLHHEVAVAALPRRHRVAVDGVHVDVDREQVVAALGAVLDDLVEEVRRGEPLALEASLHVAEHKEHRVDRAAVGRLAQLLERHSAVLARHRP